MYDALKCIVILGNLFFKLLATTANSVLCLCAGSETEEVVRSVS